MDKISAEELEITITDVPDIFRVVTNKDELELENDQKLFQFALKEEIDNDGNEVLVYGADYNEDTKIVKPLMGSDYNEHGVFTKDLFPVYPQIYKKRKESLVIVE